MATDMSLGGGAGFGANYTPIRFAPLFSLSGPARATPAPAAEEQIPQTALPFQYDTSGYGQGGYDRPQQDYYGGLPIGVRGQEEITQDMSRALSFLSNPIGTLASLAVTGKTPIEAMAQLIGGPGSKEGGPKFFDYGGSSFGAQGGRGGTNPFGSFLSLLQNFFGKMYGPEQVQLYERRAPLETATPISVQAIQVAEALEALGITPAQAAASIAAGGLGGLTSSQAAAILGGGSYSEMTGESPGFGEASVTGVTEGFGAPGSVANVSGGQAPY